MHHTCRFTRPSLERITPVWLASVLLALAYNPTKDMKEGSESRLPLAPRH